VTRIPDRDKAVARLLRTAEGVGEVGPPCPEASELAAWADAELGADLTTKIDAHIATCARCQSIVAVFVQAPGVPAAVLPFWRRPAVLLPALAIGAAAAAVLAIAVWSTPGRTGVSGTPVRTVAEATPGPVSPRPMVPPAALPSQPVGPPPQPPVSSPPSGDAKTSAPTPGSRQAAGTATPPAPFGAPAAAPPTSKAQTEVATRAQATPPPPAPTFPPPVVTLPPPPPPNSMNLDSVTKPPAAPTGRVATTNASSGTVVAESPLVDTSKVIAVLSAPQAQVPDPYAAFLAPSVARAPSALGAASLGLGRGGGGGRRAGAVPVAATPSVATARWRIATRRLEHSSNGGATWSDVTIEPTVTLTGGAAPSPDVCWLIGRGGIVLVTGDAEHFTRLDVPDPVDLVSIQVEPTKVTVTAADGTTFVTTDGGRTWIRSSLQGFVPPPF
jgi:hypothetical protein